MVVVVVVVVVVLLLLLLRLIDHTIVVDPYEKPFKSDSQPP